MDLEGTVYPLQVTSKKSQELNANEELSFRILPTKVNNAFIHDITEYWTVVDHDGLEHKVIYFKKKGEGNLLTIDIKAIPVWVDDLRRMRIYERYDEHMTAHRFFGLLLDGTDYHYILMDNFSAIRWEGLGEGDDRASIFANGIDRYGIELELIDHTFYLHSRISWDVEYMYRHKLNASNIVVENDASDFYTYARGYGDYGDGEGGEDWRDAKLIREYTSPLAEIFGKRDAPPIKNGNITDKTTMDNRLKKLVDESLKISVTASIHDLRNQGYPLAQPQLGDNVPLIDERINFKEVLRIVAVEETKDWKGDIIDIKVTFGDVGLVKRHQANIRSAVKNINNLMDGNGKLPFSVLDNAVQEVTRIIQGNEDSVFQYNDNGVIGWNGDDPRYMTRYVGDAIGFSRDGGRTFETAMTAEAGIVADVIRSGTMLADRIAGGILSSLNGRTEFDLNNGLLTMQNTEFRLGGGADIHFQDAGNRMYYQRNDWASGFGVGTSINNTYPYAHFGVSRGGKPHASDGSDFSGFIANANDREEVDDVGNSVVGNRFHVRDVAVSFSKGFVFNIDTTTPYFSPINTGTYNYNLGASNNRWNNIYGTLAGTSTHNSKTNIEDIDGRQAFDYFMMMKVKSFYYKDDDITNKYNKKASPVIEQLDPVLENLYKANDDSLDINSNLFLLARAFQYFVNKTNDRLEVLESE